MVRRRNEKAVHEDVVRVTSASAPYSADVSKRMRRYLISMGIRTGCVIGAILIPILWLRSVLILLAFVLPYVAVVMANTVSPRVDEPDVEGPGPGLHHNELGH